MAVDPALPDPVVELQTLFRYQNNTTGAVSNATLTAQQICRLLCPPPVLDINKTAQMRPTIIHKDTNVLQQLPAGSYASWRTAKTVPVLRESCALWYKFSAETGVSQTPMTCRQILDDDPKLLEANAKDGSTVRYSSECTNSEWKTLQQLPDLRKALEALYTPPPVAVPTDDAEATTADRANKSIQQELETFLSSTSTADVALPPEEEAYESDGGTCYVKDPGSGRWIHEKLAKARRPQNVTDDQKAATQQQSNDDGKLAMSQQSTEAKKRKRKGRFSARKGRCWIYVNGLPLDCSETEVAERFRTAGVLELDPETQKPKIKLYRHKSSASDDGDVEPALKGDASICFARPESVNLAITLFDGVALRIEDEKPLMSVTAAKFEQRGVEFAPKRTHVSEAKRKVAKMAAIQAMDWDEGEFNGRLTGGRKGLRIIVLKGMFDANELEKLSESDEERALHEIERDLHAKCEEWGAPIEKMTVFPKNKQGVVVLKFAHPGAASEVVKQMNGRTMEQGRTVEASFWDGKTDFTVVDEEAVAIDMEQRHEAFGNWLESQDLPEELRLQSE